MAYEKGSGCSFFDLSSTFLKPYDNLELTLIFSKPYINLERFFTKPYDNLEPHNIPVCSGLYRKYKKEVTWMIEEIKDQYPIDYNIINDVCELLNDSLNI